MGCKPILECHRRVVATLTLTLGVNGPFVYNFFFKKKKEQHSPQGSVHTSALDESIDARCEQGFRNVKLMQERSRILCFDPSRKKVKKIVFIAARKRNLGQGNISQVSVCSRGGDVCMMSLPVQRGVSFQGDPPPYGKERPVRILLECILVTARNSSCKKVMFSQACVKNSVHRVAVCPKECWDRYPLDRHPPGRHPLGKHPLPLRQILPWTSNTPQHYRIR